MTNTMTAHAPGAGLSEANSRVSPTAWWMLGVLSFFYILSCIDRLIVTMLVTPIKADLGLTDVQMGMILGPAFALSYALFGLPFGWAADKLSRRLVAFVGVTLWSLSTCAMAFADSYTQLLLCRVGVGIGEASLTPVAYTLIADTFPRKRLTLALSMYHTSFHIGAAGAMTFGGVLLVAAGAIVAWPSLAALELAPWHIVMLCVGLPGLLFSWLAFTYPEPRERVAKRKESGLPSAGLVRYMWSEKALYGFTLLGFALVTLCVYSMVNWVPTYMQRAFGWSPAMYGPILGVISALAAFTTVFKGWVVDYLYQRGVRDAHLRFYTWLLIIAIPCALGAFLVPNPVVFLILYGIVQGICLQYAIYLGATLQIVTPTEYRGRVSAFMLMIFSTIGLGLGPPLTAMMTQHVFKDEAKLGWALFTVAATMLPIALISLRIVLKHVGRALDRADAACEAAPVSAA